MVHRVASAHLRPTSSRVSRVANIDVDAASRAVVVAVARAEQSDAAHVTREAALALEVGVGVDHLRANALALRRRDVTKAAVTAPHDDDHVTLTRAAHLRLCLLRRASNRSKALRPTTKRRRRVRCARSRAAKKETTIDVTRRGVI